MDVNGWNVFSILMIVSLYLSKISEAYHQSIYIDYLVRQKKKRKVFFSKNFSGLKALTKILTECTDPELLGKSLMV